MRQQHGLTGCASVPLPRLERLRIRLDEVDCNTMQGRTVSDREEECFLLTPMQKLRRAGERAGFREEMRGLPRKKVLKDRSAGLS